jgi:hypothetical protein
MLLIVLIKEAVSIFETLVYIYQTTRRNILEESHQNTGRRENLKPHLIGRNLVTYFTSLLLNFIYKGTIFISRSDKCRVRNESPNLGLRV